VPFGLDWQIIGVWAACGVAVIVAGMLIERFFRKG
jgi:hypothetical protein